MTDSRPLPRRATLVRATLVRLLALLLLFASGLLISATVKGLEAQRLMQLAETQQHNLDLDLAVHSLQEAARFEPNDARLQLTLGAAYRTLWLFRDTADLKRAADQAYIRAGSLSPHWPVPAYEHARMYTFRGQDAQALTLLQGALGRDPNNAGYWLERARSLSRLDRLPEARTAFARCQVLRPNPECERGPRSGP